MRCVDVGVGPALRLQFQPLTNAIRSVLRNASHARRCPPLRQIAGCCSHDDVFASPYQQEVVNAMKNTYHMNCFVCVQCHQPIGTGSFHIEEGKVYCQKGNSSPVLTDVSPRETCLLPIVRMPRCHRLELSFISEPSTISV